MRSGRTQNKVRQQALKRAAGRISFPELNATARLSLISITLLFGFSWSNASAFSKLAPAEARELALERFDHAQQMRIAIESKPLRLRTIAEYSKAIETFRAVYSACPSSTKSDDALFAVGELYQSMGIDFKDPKYFRQAITAFAFLMREYPGTPHGGEAAFASAEIFLNDLKDMESAQKGFESYLRKYPNSLRARKARARLEDLRAGTLISEKREGRRLEVGTVLKSAETKNASVALEQEKEVSGKSKPKDAGAATPLEVTPSPLVRARVSGEGKPAEVKEVRFWDVQDATRFVVVLSKEIQFVDGRLSNPNRIYLDLHNAILASQLSGRSLTLSGGLERIRMGQPQKTIARIALVGEEISQYRLTTLSNPFRIVLDVQRGTQGKSRQDQSKSNSKDGNHGGTPLADELKLVVNFAREATRSAPEQPGPKQAAGRKPVRAEADSPAAPSPAAKASPEVAKSREEATQKAVKPVESDKRSESIAAAPSRPKSDGTRSLTRMLGLKIGRIVIDPGHGGHDTGTIGSSGMYEKDLVLDIALKLKNLIEEKLAGEVVLTRQDDAFIPLEARTEIANQSQADLFVSIHANSSRDRGVRGVETFFLDFTSSPNSEEVAARENASSQKTIFELQDLVKRIALREKIDESREFAQVVQKSVAKQLQKGPAWSGNRGVKQAPFIVLIGAHMPSILAEVSFLSNPSEEKLLKSPNYRQRIAQALCNGIEDYTKTLGGIKTAHKLP